MPMQPSPISETSGPFRPNRTSRISISSALRILGHRICRTPCKPHVSHGPVASETRTPPPALIHESDPGGGVMFQWNTRIATVFIVSAALATTAAAQPQKGGGKPGGAPAARAAPAPHAAAAPPPAPHVAPPRAPP